MSVGYDDYNNYSHKEKDRRERERVKIVRKIEFVSERKKETKKMT